MKESLSLIEWMDGNGASTQIKIPKILKTIHQNLQFDQMSHSLSRRKVRFPQFLIRAIKFSTIPSIIAQKFSEAMQQNFIVIGMTYYNYNIYLNISNHIKGESRTKQTQQQRSPVRYVQGLHMERAKRFELSTSTLARLHSTTELYPHFYFLGASGRNRTTDTRIFSPLLYRLSYRGIWRRRWGSNPRPPA